MASLLSLPGFAMHPRHFATWLPMPFTYDGLCTDTALCIPQVETDTWSLRKIYPLRNAWPSAIEFIPVWTEHETNVHATRLEVNRRSPPDQVVAKMRFLEPWVEAKTDIVGGCHGLWSEDLSFWTVCAGADNDISACTSAWLLSCIQL